MTDQNLPHPPTTVAPSDPWPEAVREYEEGTAHLANDDRYDRGPHKVKRLADAAIAALKEMVEEQDRQAVTALDEYNRDFAKPMLDAHRARAEKAEAEVERLKWMLDRAWEDQTMCDSYELWLASLERRWEERDG